MAKEEYKIGALYYARWTAFNEHDGPIEQIYEYLGNEGAPRFVRTEKAWAAYTPAMLAQAKKHGFVVGGSCGYTDICEEYRRGTRLLSFKRK